MFSGKKSGEETEKENVEKLRNKESSGEKESRTVMVSGLPEGSTENSDHIHFQKRKNGGGEIQKVEMLGQGKDNKTCIFSDNVGEALACKERTDPSPDGTK